MFAGIRFLARIAPTLGHIAKYKPDTTYTLADVLEERATEFADHPFVLFEDRRVSYGEMNAQSNRIAHWAHGEGLRPGDVVALQMENRPEYLSRWMGLAKLGVVTALINTNLAGQPLRHALATSNARHLILGAECAGNFATVCDDLERPLDVWLDRELGTAPSNAEESVSTRELAATLLELSEENPPASVRNGLVMRDDLLYLYTSGTTGSPKAARFSHLRFVLGGYGSTWMLKLTPADVHYCALPLYHAAGGIGVVASTLYAGATMALRRRFSASNFWDDIRTFDASIFQYIGEFCRYLVNQPARPNDTDHRVRIAIGNGLRPDIWEEFRDRFGIPQILEFYGATEGNVGFMNLENKVGSVGRVPSKLLARLSNAKLIRYDVESDTHFRGPNGLCVECDDDEAGELLGRIPKTDRVAGRFEGYTSKEATEKKILHNVLKEGDTYFRTGDLLKRDSEGFYYFIDRIGDTFRWKGENVSTQEVAEVLSGYPGIDMVNVYGVQVAGTDGRAGMVAFVLPDATQFDGAAFHAFVSSSLPAYAAPLFARVVSEPDITGTFKLRKLMLREEGWDLNRVSDALFFRDDSEGAYVPLTPAITSRIESGELRF